MSEDPGYRRTPRPRLLDPAATDARADQEAERQTDDATHDVSWIDVFETPRRAQLAEAAFVLTALGVPHEIGSDGDRYFITVPTGAAAFAARQLAEYWQEGATVRRRPPNSPAIDSGLFGVLGFLLAIWSVPWLETVSLYAFHELGIMSASGIRAGEYWRAFTALTLHADIGHIAGNTLFGILWGTLAGRQLGSGVAWLLILFAAAAANVLNGYVQPLPFRSLGASTATFAALGLLATVVWRRGYFANPDWRRSFAPVFAAVAFVAYTGIGDANTDVLAHVFGCGAGLITGLLAARLPLRYLQPRYQWLAGAGAIGVLTLAWLQALN
ncbi:MAG: rhomboid family intramembrane serine protease [Pseudomonadota bacterium]